MRNPDFYETPYIADFNDIDIAFLGIPYDGAVEARSGARQGPRQIRDYSSMMRKIHHASRINPYELCRVGDLGDVQFQQIFGVESSHQDIQKVIQEARNIIGDQKSYLSFDIDGIDPVFTPGTGTPEIGGIFPIQAQEMIRGFRGCNIVGADLVEVAPPFDPSGNTALIAATMMYEMLCIIADKQYSC